VACRVAEGPRGRLPYRGMEAAAPEYGYAMHELPPGRYGFRRWRWELWEGATLLAAGWRLTREHAERALRANASARSHARLGLRPLRPEQATAVGRFLSSAPVRVESGAVVCLLVPRGVQ